MFLRVLVRAVHACTRVCELARDIGVYIKAIVTVRAFREELTWLRRVVELTGGLVVALGPVLATDHALVGLLSLEGAVFTGSSILT